MTLLLLVPPHQFEVVLGRAPIMQPILGLSLIFFIASTASAIFNPYPEGKTADYQDNGDVGPKLFLTPYIESGMIQEARNLSFVQPLIGDVESYSGFLTVDKKCDSNMFFWFFPAEHGMEDAPVSIWLQGGPGISSMFGLLSEHGPYMLTSSNKLRLRKYTWTRFSSIIYIDSPVGTGYSYAKNEYCYSQTEEEVSRNLLLAVKQILKLFPEIKSNPFYVAGESYGGKFGPALAYAIHKDEDTSQKINLQGLAIGNGFVDPVNQLNYSDYLYQLGLLDQRERIHMTKVEDKCRTYISQTRWKKATQCFGELVGGITISTGYHDYFNFLYPNGEPLGNFDNFVANNLVRKQIHVGDATWHTGGAGARKKLLEDFMKSVRPWVEELLEHYNVLIYNGQLDMIVAYPITENYLQKLKWSAAGEYKNAERKIWRVRDSIAGYSKTAGKLTEVMVRNAGRIVPLDQPQWAYHLLSAFIHHKISK